MSVSPRVCELLKPLCEDVCLKHARWFASMNDASSLSATGLADNTESTHALTVCLLSTSSSPLIPSHVLFKFPSSPCLKPCAHHSLPLSIFIICSLGKLSESTSQPPKAQVLKCFSNYRLSVSPFFSCPLFLFHWSSVHRAVTLLRLGRCIRDEQSGSHSITPDCFLAIVADYSLFF